MFARIRCFATLSFNDVFEFNGVKYMVTANPTLNEDGLVEIPCIEQENFYTPVHKLVGEARQTISIL